MDALGTWDDAAQTDPTVRASGIALLKGILTRLKNGVAASLGQATMANSTPVAIASDQTVVPVGGTKARVTATITRPADTTAYTAKDAISSSTSAPATLQFSNMARKTGGSGYIVKAMIGTSQTTNTESFRLHLYNAAPTAINDNAACSAPLNANLSSYIGTLNFPAAKVEGTGADTAYANITPNTPGGDVPLSFVCAADANLYGLLESPNGYTPASAQTFSITLAAEQD
jgi:hypothetical protein